MIVCVFSNPPAPGRTKTRLIPALGAQGAADLARAMLLDTLEVARSLQDAEVVLATAAPMPTSLPLPDAIPLWTQGEGDLGARQERMLRRALRHGGTAMLIGTDLPGLPLERLEQGAKALRSADAVLGPAEDGGFYLIGLTRCPRGLLADLPWSSPETFTATRDRLQERGLNTATIAPWFDLDTPEDLQRVREKIEAGTIHAPHLANALNL